METESSVLDQLHFAAAELSYGRFFLPSGPCPFAACPPLQPYHRLLFVLRGEKHEIMTIDGRTETIKLRAGDSYLIEKQQWEAQCWHPSHELLCIVPRPGYLRISHYRVECDDPARPPEIAASAYHTGKPPPPALLSTFAALRDRTVASGGHVPLLIRAAAWLAWLACTGDDARGGKAQDTFHRICQYVEKNFSRALTRERVARAFRLSPGYLSELFRAMTGSGFLDYLTECRLDHARSLLDATDLPIKEIASRSGFGNEIYFIRRFRECTGLPPGQFRLKRHALRDPSP